MNIDADRLRGFLDCMHDEADERDKRSKAIADIVKAAKEAGYDTKAVRKVFVRERMDDAERAKQDNLLETYEGALGAKGRALADVRRGVPVGEAAERHGVHRATLARSRHVANEPSNATPHDAETGEVIEVETESATVVAAGNLDALSAQVCTPDTQSSMAGCENEVSATPSVGAVADPEGPRVAPPNDPEALAALDQAASTFQATLLRRREGAET